MKALQIYRTTPISSELPSPFELLFNRPPPSDLPQVPPTSQVSASALRFVDKNPTKADDNILPPGTHVMYQTPPDKTWHPAEVIKYLGYRSYKIKCDNGAVYTRSRFHLKPYTPTAKPSAKPPAPQQAVNCSSTRTRKAPDRLDL